MSDSSPSLMSNDSPKGANKKKTTPVKYSDDYNFPDGDIELVSSCSVHFRVHSYKLRAASSVFNAMIDIGGKSESDGDGAPKVQEVVLTDAQLETAAVLTAFLNVIYGKPPKMEEDDGVSKKWRQANMKLIRPLVSFAGKYDATPVSLTLAFATLSWLQKDLFDPMSAFVLGCALQDVYICKTAIKRGGAWAYKPDAKTGKANTTEFDDGVTGGSVFDLSAVPLAIFEAIPDVYKMALLRAARKYPVSVGETDWDGLADEFERGIAAYKKKAKKS
ncbi:hypothetical protein IAT38_004305 [Cryptococcus sp. DSM 104549]